MDLSEWLTEQLRLRDTNAYGISHALDVSPRTVYKWLDGTHIPSPTNCRKLARFFGVLEQDVLIIAGHLSAAREPVPIYTTETDHDLGTALQTHLAQLADSPDPIPWPDNRDQLTAELQTLSARARDTQKQRERLALALAAGHIEPAIYRTTDDGLLAKLDQLQHQTTDLQRQIDAAPDPAEIRQTLTALLAIPLAQLLQTLPPPRVRQLLSLLNLRIECDTGRILSITP